MNARSSMTLVTALFFFIPSAQAQTQLPPGTPRASKSTLSKCEAAKQARARNSPAAPGLEAQCTAQLAIEARRLASSRAAVAAESRAARKTDLQRQVAEQNQRSKEIAAALERNRDESAIDKIGNLITGGDPQPSRVAAETAVVSTVASDVAPVAAQAENTINVRVTYRKEFGYKREANLFGGVLGPTSCGAFSVAAIIADGSSRSNPLPISGDSRMAESGAFYVCS